MSTALLEVAGLAKHYPMRRGIVVPRTVGVVRAVRWDQLQRRAR